MPRLSRALACLLLPLACTPPGARAQALQPVQAIREAALAVGLGDVSAQGMGAAGLFEVV